MIIGLIEWVSSFLTSTKNKKIARYWAFMSLSWVNGSKVVTHDPCDPSKMVTHLTHDPWPISISGQDQVLQNLQGICVTESSITGSG